MLSCEWTSTTRREHEMVLIGRLLTWLLDLSLGQAGALVSRWRSRPTFGKSPGAALRDAPAEATTADLRTSLLQVVQGDLPLWRDSVNLLIDELGEQGEGGIDRARAALVGDFLYEKGWTTSWQYRLAGRLAGIERQLWRSAHERSVAELEPFEQSVLGPVLLQRLASEGSFPDSPGHPGRPWWQQLIGDGLLHSNGDRVTLSIPEHRLVLEALVAPPARNWLRSAFAALVALVLGILASWAWMQASRADELSFLLVAGQTPAPQELLSLPFGFGRRQLLSRLTDDETIPDQPRRTYDRKDLLARVLEADPLKTGVLAAKFQNCDKEAPWCADLGEAFGLREENSAGAQPEVPTSTGADVTPEARSLACLEWAAQLDSQQVCKPPAQEERALYETMRCPEAEHDPKFHQLLASTIGASEDDMAQLAGLAKLKLSFRRMACAENYQIPGSVQDGISMASVIPIPPDSIPDCRSDESNTMALLRRISSVAASAYFSGSGIVTSAGHFHVRQESSNVQQLRSVYTRMRQGLEPLTAHQDFAAVCLPEIFTRAGMASEFAATILFLHAYEEANPHAAEVEENPLFSRLASMLLLSPLEWDELARRGAADRFEPFEVSARMLPSQSRLGLLEDVRCGFLCVAALTAAICPQDPENASRPSLKMLGNPNCAGALNQLGTSGGKVL